MKKTFRLGFSLMLVLALFSAARISLKLSLVYCVALPLLALVIFCLWRPLGAIWGSVLFGALMILYLRLVIAFIPTQLYKILPYVVTVIVLIISSMRNNKEKQPPASLGLNYFREER